MLTGEAPQGARFDDVVRDLRRGLAPEPAPARGRHRGRVRPRRRGITAAVLVLVAFAVIAVLVALLLGHRSPVRAASAAVPGPVGWTGVVADLDRARVAAWSTLDPRALRGVDAPGSRAERADRLLMSRMRAARVRPVGVRFDVRAAEVVSTTGRRVRLRIVDRRTAYVLVDGSGVERQRAAARTDRVWQVDLARVGGAWRFSSERPAAG